MERRMAVAAARALLGRQLRWPVPVGEHWTPAGRSRSRREAAEAEAEAPVFQYAGERAARADRVFVWGFSFSGALGVPSFVLPASGPEPRAGLAAGSRRCPTVWNWTRRWGPQPFGHFGPSVAGLREACFVSSRDALREALGWWPEVICLQGSRDGSATKSTGCSQSRAGSGVRSTSCSC